MVGMVCSCFYSHVVDGEDIKEQQRIARGKRARHISRGARDMRQAFENFMDYIGQYYDQYEFAGLSDLDEGFDTFELSDVEDSDLLSLNGGME